MNINEKLINALTQYPDATVQVVLHSKSTITGVAYNVDNNIIYLSDNLDYLLNILQADIKYEIEVF